MPGKYTVSLEKRDEQGIAELAAPTPFEVEPLNFATLSPPDREAIIAFAKQTGELQRAALGTLEALNPQSNFVRPPPPGNLRMPGRQT